MKKLFILVNKLIEFDCLPYVDKYLADVDVSIGEHLPVITDDYDLIVLWNYHKIISNLTEKNRIVVFHSSNLPQGKGWAPIYHTIANGEKYYTVTGIIVNEQIDAGDVLIKARFKMQDNYFADQIRDWDNRIMLILTGKILSNYSGKNRGAVQKGQESFYPRRYAADNEIPLDVNFRNIINHLRACETAHPAFFWLNDTKYNVYIEPETKAEFPSDLEIEFYGNLE